MQKKGIRKVRTKSVDSWSVLEYFSNFCLFRDVFRLLQEEKQRN